MKISITAKHYEMPPELERYIEKKLNRLVRYTPKSLRHNLHSEVILTELKGKSTNPFQCEVLVHLPHGKLVASESTINMFAAVDIVEAKIRNQLSKYKGKNHPEHRGIRLLRRLSGRV